MLPRPERGRSLPTLDFVHRAVHEYADFGPLVITRMQEQLDATDLQILELLQADASVSAADVATRVGLSQSPCWRRIHRLEQDGYIAARVALLDRKRLGLRVLVFVQVKLVRGARTALAEFEAAVRSFPEVLECHMLMGETDFLLKVVTRDVDSYEKFLRDQLSCLPAVQEVQSSMALTNVKSTTCLPLGLLREQAG
jgi:Lrp/AsnC family transcriptional regulator